MSSQLIGSTGYWAVTLLLIEEASSVSDLVDQVAWENFLLSLRSYSTHRAKMFKFFAPPPFIFLKFRLNHAIKFAVCWEK